MIAKPKAPKRLDVSAISYDSVTLSWHMPDDAEASMVTSYRVEKREVSNTIWETVASIDASENTYTVRSDEDKNSDCMDDYVIFTFFVVTI